MPVDELRHRTACEERMGSLEEVLPSPSLFCSPHDRPMNPRDRGVDAKNTLFGKLADQEDGRLKPQSNHLVWVWMQVLS